METKKERENRLFSEWYQAHKGQEETIPDFQGVLKWKVTKALTLQRAELVEWFENTKGKYKGDGLVGRREDMYDIIMQEVIDHIKE